MGVTAAERAERRPGDELIARPDVTMDRGFDVPGAPADVWPWLVQLGKRRAGWYLPRPLERVIPRSRRAIRRLDPRWTSLAVGDVIPDYGGAAATFSVAGINPPHALVYSSTRGRVALTWSIVLRPVGPGGPGGPGGPVGPGGPDGPGGPGGAGTRVLLRLRLAPVRHRRLAALVGGAFDALTIVGMAAGLRERVTPDR